MSEASLIQSWFGDFLLFTVYFVLFTASLRKLSKLPVSSGTAQKMSCQYSCFLKEMTCPKHLFPPQIALSVFKPSLEVLEV